MENRGRSGCVLPSSGTADRLTVLRRRAGRREARIPNDAVSVTADWIVLLRDATARRRSAGA